MINLSKFVFLLAVVSVVRCSDDGVTALCEDDGSEPSVLAACVTGPSLEEPNQWPGVLEHRIEGVVEGIGKGGTDDCFGPWFGSLGDHVEAGAPELADAKWISLRTAKGELHRVEAIVPGGFQWAVAVADDIVVDLRQHWHGFVPTDSNLEVRVLEGDLVYWMGSSWKLERLTPPAEVELADGGDGCRVIGDNCLAEWEERSLRVSVDGETETVAYGAHAPVGSLTVVNHAFEVETVPTTCADHFVGTAEAATWAN